MRASQLQLEVFYHSAQLAYLIRLRVFSLGLHAQRPLRLGVNIDAVASACPVVPEAESQQQPFKVTKRDRASALHHSIEYLGWTCRRTDFLEPGDARRLTLPPQQPRLLPLPVALGGVGALVVQLLAL